MATPETLRLTLDDAVARRRAVQRRSARRARRREHRRPGRKAFAAALPQVTAASRTNRKFDSIFPTSGGSGRRPAWQPGLTPFGAVHAGRADLTATQLLWSAGRVGAGLWPRRPCAARRSPTATRRSPIVRMNARTAYPRAAYARCSASPRKGSRSHARAPEAGAALPRAGLAFRVMTCCRRRWTPRTANRSGGRGAQPAAAPALLDLRRALNPPLSQPLVARHAAHVPRRQGAGARGPRPTGSTATIVSADAMVRARRGRCAPRRPDAGRSRRRPRRSSHQATRRTGGRTCRSRAIDGSVKLGGRSSGLPHVWHRAARLPRNTARQRAALNRCAGVALQVEQAKPRKCSARRRRSPRAAPLRSCAARITSRPCAGRTGFRPNSRFRMRACSRRRPEVP